MAQTATQTPKKPGRPTVYEDSLVAIAATAARFGATDQEIAAECGIGLTTLYRWYATVPEFRQAVKEGAQVYANERVGRTMYSRATGYYYTEQQAVKIKTGPDTEEVEIVDVERYQQPSDTAAIFWLKNRDKDNWRDVHKIEGSIDHKHTHEAPDLRTLALAMLNMLQDATGAHQGAMIDATPTAGEPARVAEQPAERQVRGDAGAAGAGSDTREGVEAVAGGRIRRRA